MVTFHHRNRASVQGILARVGPHRTGPVGDRPAPAGPRGVGHRIAAVCCAVLIVLIVLFGLTTP
ncbi:hypothetical protein [Streptomyces sp. NPDC049887]|uniref:hypothetical protein n=1 Tax=unclassified Streptomyces TaxID=2593676 RepID=UPI0034150C8E